MVGNCGDCGVGNFAKSKKGIDSADPPQGIFYGSPSRLFAERAGKGSPKMPAKIQAVEFLPP